MLIPSHTLPVPSSPGWVLTLPVYVFADREDYGGAWGVGGRGGGCWLTCKPMDNILADTGTFQSGLSEVSLWRP